MKANGILALCMTACFVAAGADADQKLYRWTDANGRVFYTDKPPPTDARNVERKRLGDRAGSGPLPYATQMAAKSFPVTLYTSDCGEACDEGRKLAELLKLTGGTSVEVPVLVVGRTIVRGWEATQWHSTLDAAGYPKSSPVRPQAAAATRKSGAGTPTELSRNARDPALPQPARPQPATDQTP